MSLTDAERKARRKARRRLARARAEGMLAGVVSMLRPGDVAVDCGANVGEVAAQLAATGARVHAFEPDPLAFAALSDRLGKADNVTLHNAAVGPEAGQGALHRAADFADDPTARTTRSTLVPGGAGMDSADTLPVTVVDLPDFLRTCLKSHDDIAFLKLDIEGAELALLDRLDRDGLLHRIRLTVAETHEGKFPALRASYKALRDRIAATYPKTRVNLEWT